MSSKRLDLTRLEHFLGDDRIQGEMNLEHLARFKERFSLFFNAIEKAKIEKENESTIERAIRRLVSEPTKE